jgi:LPS O-antigen subunit length determinant protein (WzzB/FepE family)
MSIKTQLLALINLAHIDEEFDENEKNLIYVLGKANGVAEKEIDEMISKPNTAFSIETLNEDDKFEMLYNVVQLMKIDREVYLSEIKYCEDLAVKLGYKKSVISELSSKIYSDPSITSDRDALKASIKKHVA